MTVALRGPSAVTLTAGILLLSRARGFGQRLTVEIVGDPERIAALPGPALLHNTVLASCGVGRALGSGPLVIVPGPTVDPLALSFSPEGTDGWFLLDRTGSGSHTATHQFIALCREQHIPRRALARQMRAAMTTLGCSAEPAVLDLLFGSPLPPLLRLSLALRAGRAMSGGRGVSITHFLHPSPAALPDALPLLDLAGLQAHLHSPEALQSLSGRLIEPLRGPAESWTRAMLALDARYETLVVELLGLLSHVLSLPPQGMLPPLSAPMDAVAAGLDAAMGASGTEDALQSLMEVFVFLGGRFTPDARHPIVLAGAPPPPDRLSRWSWLCQGARQAAADADALWRQVVDPPQ